MGIRVGFVGPLKGMTAQQKAALSAWLDGVEVAEWLTFGCRGADEEACEIVCRGTRAAVVVYPPRPARCLSKLVLAVALRVDDGWEYGPIGPLVDAADVVVCALSPQRIVRGGVDRTKRYAKVVGKARVYLYPEGSTVAKERVRP